MTLLIDILRIPVLAFVFCAALAAVGCSAGEEKTTAKGPAGNTETIDESGTEQIPRAATPSPGVRRESERDRGVIRETTAEVIEI